jgi:hypothetical protein
VRVNRGAGRSPLREPPLRAGSDLEGDPAIAVLPDRRDRVLSAEQPDRLGNCNAGTSEFADSHTLMISAPRSREPTITEAECRSGKLGIETA